MNQYSKIDKKMSYNMTKRILDDPRLVLKSNDKSLFSAAARNKNPNLNIVKLLLDDGRIDPNSRFDITIYPSLDMQNLTVLEYAKQVNNKELIKLILADPRVNLAKL